MSPVRNGPLIASRVLHVLTKPQKTALASHCRLSIETMHARFIRWLPIGVSVVLTVNSGYE